MGPVDATNFANLPQLAQMLKQQENNAIVVWTKRNGQMEQLSLTPKAWSGNGLLGATLTKI